MHTGRWKYDISGGAHPTSGRYPASRGRRPASWAPEPPPSSWQSPVFARWADELFQRRGRHEDLVPRGADQGRDSRGGGHLPAWKTGTCVFPGALEGARDDGGCEDCSKKSCVIWTCLGIGEFVQKYCWFEALLAETSLYGAGLPRALTKKFRDTAEILYALCTLPNRLTQICVSMHIHVHYARVRHVAWQSTRLCCTDEERVFRVDPSTAYRSWRNSLAAKLDETARWVV